MRRPTAATDRLRRLGALAALAAVLTLSACLGPERLTAANDVHAFLLSIRDDDRAAFNAHVDRPALKAQLGARLMDEAAQRGPAYEALAAVFGQTLMDVGVDKLVRPDVFRFVAEQLGYSPDKPIPGPIGIAEALRPIDADHVCVVTRRDGPCLFTFADEDGVWRLTAFNGELADLAKTAQRP
jgi:hypothetical protein